MSNIRIARDGVVLGDFSLEHVAEGAFSGAFLPTDDALTSGSVEWVKLVAVSGVEFPFSAFPVPPVPAPPMAPPPPLPAKYNGVYRSSDEKVLVGLCAGLAHKMEVEPGLVRFGVVLTWFFTASATFWIYWFALLLPKLPTRNLRRS